MNRGRLARTRILTGTALAMLLALISPAWADWTQYRTGATRNAVVDAAPDVPLDRITSVTTPNEVRATPTIIDGDLLVGNHDSGTLQRIDPATGAMRWQITAPNWIHSEMVWAGDTGVVGYGNRYFPGDEDDQVPTFVRGTSSSGVLAVDLDTGDIRWRYRTIGEVMPTPVIRDGRVYVATGDRALHVLDLDDGRQTGLIRLGSFVSMASPALDDAGRLFVGGGNPYRFYRVDIADQTIAWKTLFADVVAGLDDVPPAVSGDTVFTSAVVPRDTPGRFDHVLYALDANTGAIRWQTSLGDGPEVKNNRSGAPTVAGDVVVVGSPTSGRLQAFSIADGTRRWQVDSGPMKAAPAIDRAAGRVYATNLAGEVLVVALDDGRVLKRLTLSDAPLAPAGPVLTAKHLVVPSQDHHVYLVPLALLGGAAD